MSRKERFAIAWWFSFEGILSGSFSGCADMFKENNHWGSESFGWMIFLCVGAGIASVPMVAKLCDMHGSKNVTLASSAGLLVSTPFMAMFTATEGYGSYLLLVICIIIFGVLMAALDICVNAQACVYEKLTNSSHMGFMHALYAVGAVLGSLGAGLLIRLGYSFFQILCIICMLCGIISPGFLNIISKEEEERLNESAQASSDSKGDIEFEKLSAAASKILSSVPMKTFSSVTGHKESISTETDVELSLGAVGSSSKYEFLLVDDDEDDEDEEEEIIFNPVDGSSSSSSSDGSSSSSGGKRGRERPTQAVPSGSVDKAYTLLVALTLTLCIAFLVEGSIGDWSAIYLAEECKVPKSSGLDSIGYATFNAFVVLSRLLVDKAEGKFGRRGLLKACAVCSLLGFWVTALAPRFGPEEAAAVAGGEGNYAGSLAVASVGFALTGLSLGPVSAVVMAASGQIKGIDPTSAVSTVSGLSYVGLLAGPIILGLVAQNFSLATAFFLSGVLIVTVYPLAGLL